MKNILITGSSGMVGKNLVELLIKQDLLNKYNFIMPSSKELDMLDINSVSKYFSSHSIDCVISLCAICGGLGLNSKRPADLTHLNMKMIVNLFDMIREYDIKQLISLGSVCSYPAFAKIPFSEIDIFGPPSEITNRGYGESKKALITQFQMHMTQYGLTGTILVPTNLFGFHDHFDDLENNHIVPALIKKIDNAIINNASSINCFGDGSSTRDLLIVKELCKALITVLENDISSYDPINIGSGTDISIYDLAHLIAKLMNWNGKIIFDGSVGNGQQKRLLNISSAHQKLNWQPTVSLEEGLKQTINWYKENTKKLPAYIDLNTNIRSFAKHLQFEKLTNVFPSLNDQNIEAEKEWLNETIILNETLDKECSREQIIKTWEIIGDETKKYNNNKAIKLLKCELKQCEEELKQAEIKYKIDEYYFINYFLTGQENPSLDFDKERIKLAISDEEIKPLIERFIEKMKKLSPFQ